MPLISLIAWAARKIEVLPLVRKPPIPFRDLPVEVHCPEFWPKQFDVPKVRNLRLTIRTFPIE